ncbi:MAG: hypothetical protein PHQ82_04410, partial [Bacteroidales bacterium]|nr:hypothetical protein [Bacteroidales bacterium]
LFIENKDDIDSAQVLFLTEKKFYHLCGYHYEIFFWYDSDSLYSSGCLNKECENFVYKPIEAQKLLTTYGKKLKTNPDHYIYALAIPVTFSPTDVKKELRDKGLIVFSFEDELNRFPRLTFSFRNNTYVEKDANNETWKMAEENNEIKTRMLIMEIVDSMRTHCKVLNEPEIFYDSQGAVLDSITHRGTIDLFFATEKDLLLAKNILNQPKVEEYEINIPKTYNLQLIDTSDNIKKVKNKLREFKFIKKVTPYLENYFQGDY